MKNFLRFDNPMFVFVGKIIDVVVVHFLWIICCLPIVTIGPATTAMYYSLMKDVSDEDTRYVKNYFKSFKENLKQGIPLGILVILAGVVIASAAYYYIQAAAQEGGAFYVMKYMSYGMAIIYILMLQYVFALQARFYNTIKNTIKNALLFTVKNIGWSIVMLLVVVLWYGLIIMTNFLPLFMIGYGMVVYLNARILNKIFQPFIEEEQKKAAEEEEKTDSLAATPEEMAEWEAPLSTAAVLEKMARENAAKNEEGQESPEAEEISDNKED